MEDLVENITLTSQMYSIGTRKNGDQNRYNAASASEKDIDPIKVRTKIIEVLGTVERGLKRIRDAINDISCGGETLKVEDKTMEALITSVADEIGGKGTVESQVTKQIAAELNKIYEAVTEYYNAAQKYYNQMAHDNAQDYAGTDGKVTDSYM